MKCAWQELKRAIDALMKREKPVYSLAAGFTMQGFRANENGYGLEIPEQATVTIEGGGSHVLDAAGLASFFHVSVSSSSSSLSVTACGLPDRPYLVTEQPRVSIPMPSRAVPPASKVARAPGSMTRRAR